MLHCIIPGLSALDESNMNNFLKELIPQAFPVVSDTLRIKSDEQEFVATSYIFCTLNNWELNVAEGKVLISTKTGSVCGSVCGDLDLLIFAILRYVVYKNNEFERIFDGQLENDVTNLVAMKSVMKQ